MRGTRFISLLYSGLVYMTYQPSFLPPKPAPRLEEKSPRFVPKPKSLLQYLYTLKTFC